jgi:type II secretory pathway pseudopilin PulG
MIRHEDGFTLVELLISIVLMLAVMGTAFTALQQFETTSVRNARQNESQDQARNAIDQIIKRLRNDASPTPGSPQAIDRATSKDLIFQTVNPIAPGPGNANAHNIMRVRYCLDDSTPANSRLYLQEQRWTTAIAPDPPAADSCPEPPTNTEAGWQGTPRIVVDHLTNSYDASPRPLWKFDCPTGFDADTCAAGTDLDMLARVKRIAITMFVDQNPATQPAETRLTTGVFFRNQNAQPAAVMSQPVVDSNGHVHTSASDATDPDADRLYYRWCWFVGSTPNQSAAWCEGGTELADRQMTLDYDASGTHGSAWLGLRVQDTGGLVAYDYKAVTLP